MTRRFREFLQRRRGPTTTTTRSHSEKLANQTRRKALSATANDRSRNRGTGKISVSRPSEISAPRPSQCLRVSTEYPVRGAVTHKSHGTQRSGGDRIDDKSPFALAKYFRFRHRRCRLQRRRLKRPQFIQYYVNEDPKKLAESSLTPKVNHYPAVA